MTQRATNHATLVDSWSMTPERQVNSKVKTHYSWTSHQLHARRIDWHRDR